MPKLKAPVPSEHLIAEMEKIKNPTNGLVRMKMDTDLEVPYMKGQIAGFTPDQAAHLFIRKWAFPCDEKGIQIKLERPPEPPKVTPPQAVEIPANWTDLHHIKRIGMANALDGKPLNASRTAEDADNRIRAELDRRREQDGVDSQDAA